MLEEILITDHLKIDLRGLSRDDLLVLSKMVIAISKIISIQDYKIKIVAKSTTPTISSHDLIPFSISK